MRNPNEAVRLLAAVPWVGHVEMAGESLLVSAPLLWKELGPKLDPKSYTIASLPKRMKKLGEDPLAAVLKLTPDVPAALARLGNLLR